MFYTIRRDNKLKVVHVHVNAQTCTSMYQIATTTLGCLAVSGWQIRQVEPHRSLEVGDGRLRGRLYSLPFYLFLIFCEYHAPRTSPHGFTVVSRSSFHKQSNYLNRPTAVELTRGGEANHRRQLRVRHRGQRDDGAVQVR